VTPSIWKPLRLGATAIAPLLQALTAAAALCAGTAVASDRPFLATNSAAAEEDDDNVWSVESWFTRVGSVRGLSLAPEYAFNPTTSIQFEYTRAHDRAAGATEQEFELEFKYLFNHIARDGYGWGIVPSLGFAKESGSGWRYNSLGLTLPYTLELWEREGALHLNVGVSKSRDARREFHYSAALERQVFKRTTLFGEIARQGDATLLHGGVRHWLKKEKFAVDISALRSRAPGSREHGWVLGVGWYDL
jgi:hypothetical protein